MYTHPYYACHQLAPACSPKPFLYAVGGYDGNDNRLSSSERYAPDTNSWSPIASMGTASLYPGLTTLNNNLYAVDGEARYLDYLNTAERYDLDTDSWTPIASMC